MYLYSASTRGFYVSPNDAPADAVEVTVEEYDRLFEGQAKGFEIVASDDGKPTLLDRRPGIDFFRDRALKVINGQAEAQFSDLASNGSRMALIYRAKIEEAQHYLAAKAPKDADYPLLMADVGLDVSTLSQAADRVLSAYAKWKLANQAIERARRAARIAITNAKTLEEIQAITLTVD